VPVEEPSTASKEEEWINDLDYPNHHGNLHRTRNQRLPARRVLIVGDALKREDPDCIGWGLSYANRSSQLPCLCDLFS
jgi:hypothetical protein